MQLFAGLRNIELNYNLNTTTIELPVPSDTVNSKEKEKKKISCTFDFANKLAAYELRVRLTKRSDRKFYFTREE